MSRDIGEEMYTANILKLLEIVSQRKMDPNTQKLVVTLTSMASNRIMKGYPQSVDKGVDNEL